MHDRAAVATFMEQARAALAGGVDEETLEEVGRVLSRVSQESGFVEETEMRSLHGSDASFTILQTDPDGLTLMLARFPPTAETPVHDHGSWGVACVLRGRDRYRHWVVADGAVRILYEKELGPGDFVTWPEPPHDIHSQQGVGGDALELVLFGRNVAAIPRHYFDPKTKEVRTAPPQ